MHAIPKALERTQTTFALAPVGEVTALERQWRALDRIGGHSFFASWPWVAATLAMAPRPLALITASRNGSLAGLALARLSRWPRRAWLNASGDRALDGVMVEHNGFALPARTDAALLADLVAWFAGGAMAVSELILPGIAETPPVLPGLIVREDTRKAYRTRLSDLGADGIAPLLSRNGRQQLRRSLRDFGGELRVETAADAATAWDWFGALKALHVRSWSRRGRRHAFDNPAFEPFHRLVITTGVADGSVDLLRITAGERVLGYLYNFKRNGVVHSYQSGFSDDDKSLRPGYVCHALAIGHYAKAGMALYDFLAGTNRLKQSFGADVYEMHWCRYRQPTLVYRLDHFLHTRFTRTPDAGR